MSTVIRGAVVQPRRSGILFTAFVAFAAANLIHNNLGVDPALAPAALLTGLYGWRPGRGFLWGAALVIALPAFIFLKWSALAQPADAQAFFNHVALFLAGALAVLSVVVSLLMRQPAARPS
ncbi:MAG: hypothetical protein ACRENP_15375 [Longimicrobiales bacterium]